jgi:hypothetical protein
VPNFIRVYRKNASKITPGISLHILLLKCDGYKLPRNLCSGVLEAYCDSLFYGPLVVAYNSNDPPYKLISFHIVDLHRIKDCILNENKPFNDTSRCQIFI